MSINIGLLAVGLIGTELTFGTWLSRDPLDRVNILRGASVRVDARGLYPDGRVFTYERNHWGFRGGEIDPSTIDIVTIGGSTTNQLYLPEDQTWQAAMQRRLRELGNPLTVANAGFEGQSTYGLLFEMEAWFPFVPGLQPKFILAYVGINDVFVAHSTRDRLRFSSTARWIQYNSALFRFGRTVLGMSRARAARISHFSFPFSSAAWTGQGNYADNEVALPTADPISYGTRLRELVARIRSFGAQPILVTQARGDSRIVDGKVIGLASNEGLNGVDQWRLLAAFNKVTQSVCAEQRVLCIDAARGIDYEIGDFYDIVHAGPRGAQKLGRYLAEQLVNEP